MSLFAVGTILACVPAQLRAQNDGPPPPGTPMYTLHVYTNLVQIPTLVLNQDLKPLPPLTKDQFTLSLDNGPKFRPTQIHLEGEDPIVMAILLDDSGSEHQLMRKAAVAIAGLSQHALAPHDRVALFAFDCSLVSAPHLLEPDPVKLHAAVEELLKTPGFHGPKGSPESCYHQSHVWNTMTSVVNAVARFPGRRVLVAVSDAFDHDSKVKRADLQQFATSLSLSIFTVDFDNRINGPWEFMSLRDSQNDLQLLTSGTGGLAFQTTPQTFTETLQHIVTLLRGRYIIEFPRPSNGTAGNHVIDVQVPKKNAITRSAGVSVPLPSDKELHDPDNVPSDPTRAPTQGAQKRKSH